MQPSPHSFPRGRDWAIGHQPKTLLCSRPLKDPFFINFFHLCDLQTGHEAFITQILSNHRFWGAEARTGVGRLVLWVEPFQEEAKGKGEMCGTALLSRKPRGGDSDQPKAGPQRPSWAAISESRGGRREPSGCGDVRPGGEPGTGRPARSFLHLGKSRPSCSHRGHRQQRARP